MNNPFEITKAVDFTDEEIVKYWIDLSDDGGGFANIIKPTTTMPLILLGSKGSGKTHLMRYYSYELQKIRHRKNLSYGLNSDRFIGVYIRCSGINSDKFSGKGQAEDIWASVYAYYWELWIAQCVLKIVSDLQKEDALKLDNEQLIVNKVLGLFNKKIESNPQNVKELIGLFSDLQKDVDYNVENCIFNKDKRLEIDILLSPASISYGIPSILKEHIPFFKNIIFLYLIDEFENISGNQQRLIQTLIREKNNCCTYRIGSRLYGIKTYSVLGSGEVNRKGSEFDEVELDYILRSNEKNYAKFVKRICDLRLELNGVNIIDGDSIDSYIDTFNLNHFKEKFIDKKRWMDKFKRKLKLKYNESDIARICANIQCEDILAERAAILLIYRDWKDKQDIVKSSVIVHQELEKYLSENLDNSISKLLEHFKKDLIDNLFRETQTKIPYCGFDDFIKMSSGSPRNILNLLKYSYKWTYYNKAKKVFDEVHIDEKSQYLGVKDTIDWFFEDNRIPAIGGGNLLSCIERLGSFLRELRFSDAPPECSINLISIDFTDISEEVKTNIYLLKNYSYIIPVDDRRDKNSNDQVKSFVINRIIAPHWELPLSKRGRIKLTRYEAECIFGLSKQDNYESMLSEKIKKYTAPFGTHEIITPSLFSDEQ